MMMMMMFSSVYRRLTKQGKRCAHAHVTNALEMMASEKTFVFSPPDHLPQCASLHLTNLVSFPLRRSSF